MRKKLCWLIIFCLMPCFSWAAKCTTTKVSVWSDNTAWDGSCASTGVPGRGAFANYSGIVAHNFTIDDTTAITHPIVVNTAKTLNITSSSVAVGISGTPTDKAMLTAVGTATINISGSLTMLGDIIGQRGSTINGQAGGSLTLSPPTGTIYRWRSDSTGSGQATLKTTGTGWGAGQYFTVQDGGLGGISRIVAGDPSTAYLYGDTDFAYTKFLHLGSATVNAWMNYGQTAAMITRIKNTLWIDCGQISVGTIQGPAIVDIDALDKRDLTVFPPGYTFGVGGTFAISTGSRSVKNVTIYSAGPTGAFFNLVSKDTLFQNIVTYNMEYDTTASTTNTTLLNLLCLNDYKRKPYINMYRGGGNIMKDSVMLNHADNPSYAYGDNVDGWIFDGDNFVGSDGGDCTGVAANNGITTIKNNIVINLAGVLHTNQGTGTTVSNVTNNTVYRANLINEGEIYGSATNLGDVKNNLIVTSDAGSMGITQAGVATVPQTNFNLDYNNSWNNTIPADGRTYAVYKAGHPLSGQTGYLHGGGTDYAAAWWSDGRVLGDANAGLHDLKVDPRFKNNSWTVRGYMGAASVQDAAREAIKLNGWDYLGNRVTPTVFTPLNVLTAGRTAFTPQNPALKGTGYLGADIGAVPVKLSGNALWFGM